MHSGSSYWFNQAIKIASRRRPGLTRHVIGLKGEKTKASYMPGYHIMCHSKKHVKYVANYFAKECPVLIVLDVPNELVSVNEVCMDILPTQLWNFSVLCGSYDHTLVRHAHNYDFDMDLLVLPDAVCYEFKSRKLSQSDANQYQIYRQGKEEVKKYGEYMHQL